LASVQQAPPDSRHHHPYVHPDRQRMISDSTATVTGGGGGGGGGARQNVGPVRERHGKKTHKTRTTVPKRPRNIVAPLPSRDERERQYAENRRRVEEQKQEQSRRASAAAAAAAASAPVQCPVDVAMQAIEASAAAAAAAAAASATATSDVTMDGCCGGGDGVVGDNENAAFGDVVKTSESLRDRRKQFPGTGTAHSAHFGTSAFTQPCSGFPFLQERTTVRGLVRSLHGKEEPWPQTSEYACWHDGHCFDGCPFGVPVRWVETEPDKTPTTVYMIGNFCSPNCAAAFNHSMESIPSRTRGQRHSMLMRVCKEFFGMDLRYRPFCQAPPRQALAEYQRDGMTIEEYRKSFRRGVEITFVPPMLLLVTPEVQCVTTEMKTRSDALRNAQRARGQHEVIEQSSDAARAARRTPRTQDDGRSSYAARQIVAAGKRHSYPVIHNDDDGYGFSSASGKPVERGAKAVCNTKPPSSSATAAATGIEAFLTAKAFV